MTYRELFNEIMFYGEFDRMPVIHWTGWPETRERWLKEGLPADKSEHEFFNAVPMWTGVGVVLGLRPGFEYELLEETDEYRIFRGGDGVVSQDWKNKSCIPHFIDFTLKDGSNWDEYKKRAAEKRKVHDKEIISIDGALADINAELAEENQRKTALKEIKNRLELHNEDRGTVRYTCE